MALDYLQIVRYVESIYPNAQGGSTRDAVLQSNLVNYANQVYTELNLLQRFSYDFVRPTQLTTAGTATYAMPTNMTAIKQIYWLDSTSIPHYLDKYERAEPQKIYGDPTVSSNVFGSPKYFSLDNRTLQIFPAPDTAGNDTGGNYLLYIEGYTTLLPIVETTGTTDGIAAVVTVPDTAYLTYLNVGDGADISIRGAGYPGANGTPQDFATTASTIAASGTTSALTAIPPTATAAVQTFYNSKSWVITWWPKLLEFGMLREVATYLQDSASYQQWEARYQNEIQLLRTQEADRIMTRTVNATAQFGQLDDQLRDNSSNDYWDVRP